MKRQPRGTSTSRRLGWSDWRIILRRTRHELRDDNVAIVSGGVAFFLLLGVIPSLAALISITGLILDPTVVQQQIEALGSVIPADAKHLLEAQLKPIFSSSNLVSFGAMSGFLMAVWSGSYGMKALIQALNIVYDLEERRSVLRFNLFSLLLTVGAVLMALLVVGAIMLLPSALRLVGVTETSRAVVSALRWPLLIGLFTAGLALLYRYGPNRERARWRWITWGSGLATAVWIGASILFSFFVSHFGMYNKIYGSLGAVVVLLLWFYLTAYVLLLGAELDSEIENRLREGNR